MGCEAGGSLHMLFFPLMAPGHMMPMLDMAKLFAARGVLATVLTTAANAPLVNRSLDTHSHTHVSLLLLPSAPLPCENLASAETYAARNDFFTSLHALRQPFEQVLYALLPDCVVADMFFPWAAITARDRGVPLLAFHGYCFFALCAEHSVFSHELPPAASAGGARPFILPGLPHCIEMHASQFPDLTKPTPEFIDLLAEMKGMVSNSYGVLVNSFYELEPDYVDHYSTVVGVRAWHVGPVSLFNRSLAEQSTRGGGGDVSSVVGDCLRFLDRQRPGSVVYVCFGSLFRFASAQLGELARGLEDSGRPFLWAVKGSEAAVLPDGFEERVGERGLVIRGWAPQTVILGHVAVGGFVTHCGWNSSLEGISAGRAMVTWPLFADQFFNERLIVDVLRIGIGVGAKEYFTGSEETPAVVAAEEVRRAVERVMGDGEEAEGMRRRTGELAEKARRAVEKGGSSYVYAGDLIRELIDRKAAAIETH